MIKSKYRFAIALSFLAAPLIAGCSSRGSPDPEFDVTQVDRIRAGLTSAVSKLGPGGDSKSGDKGLELKRIDGWVTLKGRFKLDGAPRDQAKLDITKDNAVCGAHQLFDESLVVGKDGGLANVAIYVRTPKIPINKDYEKDATASVVLDNKGCRFEPHVQHVRVGQTLVVHNSDKVAHNSSLQGKSLQGNPLIPPDSTAEFKIQAAEKDPAPVSCSIHPWMKARVVATSNPYCAVSDKDGVFEIANLPAGELEIQIWQESVGPLEVKSDDLKPSGPGRYIISLDPEKDKPKDLKELIVSAAVFK